MSVQNVLCMVKCPPVADRSCGHRPAVATVVARVLVHYLVLLARKAMNSEVEIHQNFGVKNAPNIFRNKPVVL
jgi:hypothetical protein